MHYAHLMNLPLFVLLYWGSHSVLLELCRCLAVCGSLPIGHLQPILHTSAALSYTLDLPHPPLSLHCRKSLLTVGRLLGLCAHYDGISRVGYVWSQLLHWFQWSSITLLCPCTAVTFLQHSYKLGHKTCALLLYIVVKLLHQQTCGKPLLHDLRQTSFGNRVSWH